MDVIAGYKCAGLSDPGRKRDNNEDRFHADPERGIFFVIDGVGGHNAGEKAAETAYTLLRARLERQTGTISERIREAITVANNEIYTLARSNPQWDGMACVLTAAVLDDGHVVVGHVGDSRLYLVQDGEIRKLTHDHSPVGEREDRGELDEMSAMRHPRRNEVFRDVGSQQHSPEDPDFIEISTIPFTPSSALVLCSDGLSDLVSSGEILAIVEVHSNDAQVTARALIDAANAAGGKDNVTVVVVHGRDFAASTPRANPLRPVPALVPGRAAPVRGVSVTPLLAVAIGFLISALLFAAFKPHWRETDKGIAFGFGALREPRIWRVQGDIGTVLQQARKGDTVLVAPGTYAEQIRLREGIAVVSERPREAILQTWGVAVTADDITGARIEGFRIISDEGQPLNVGVQVSDSDIDVFDMDISGAQTAGIEILGESSGTFRANNVSSNKGSGVIIRDSAKPRFVHNVVTNNGRGSGSPRPGIEVAGSAQPSLAGNVVSNNAAEQIWAPHLNLESLKRQNFLLTPDLTLKQAARPKPRARPAK
jgi:parallel beta-helix repeat protein